MSVFYPNSGTLEIASGVQTMLALSKLRLFKSTLSPGVTTTKAQLLAEEADFTGYPAGGETVTAFLSPGLYPLGGAHRAVRHNGPHYRRQLDRRVVARKRGR